MKTHGFIGLIIKIPSPSVFKKRCSCCIFLMCLFTQMSYTDVILIQRGAYVILSVLSSTLSYSCFSPHHCPSPKDQSLGHPHPSPSPRSPGTVTRPLQRCFQLQEKKKQVSHNKILLNKIHSEVEISAFLLWQAFICDILELLNITLNLQICSQFVAKKKYVTKSSLSSCGMDEKPTQPHAGFRTHRSRSVVSLYGSQKCLHFS